MSRMQTMNVCSFLVPLHFLTTRSARVEQSTGMNGHRTDKFHTRVVSKVIDLIVEKRIVVLGSARKDFCSGSSSYCCRLDSLGWLLTITSVGVEWQEGAFFLFFCPIFYELHLSALERFDYQAKSTDQSTEATQGLLLPWLQFLGSSSGLLESLINGWLLEWRRRSEL